MVREPWSKIKDAFLRYRHEAGMSSAESGAAAEGGRESRS
jgi:hypothetical protein